MKKLLHISACCLMLLLFNTVQLNAQNANYSFTTPASAEYINEINATIPVSMNNTGNIVGFQCDIYLPDGMTIQDGYTTSPILLSERAVTHVVASNKLTNGAIRVLVYSLNNDAFVGSEGVLFNLPVTVASGEGTYTVDIKNIHATGIEAVDFKLADISASVTMIKQVLGDVDGDGLVSIGDVSTMINYILGKLDGDFASDVADVNGDGEVNIADVVALVNIILRENTTARTATRVASILKSATTTDRIFINDFSIEPGETKTIEVKLASNLDYTAFQCDFYLPEGIRLVEGANGAFASVSSGIENTHAIASALQYDGSLRIIAYSLLNAHLNENGETVFNITVQADENLGTELTSSFRNVLLATAEAKEFSAPTTTTAISAVPTSIEGVTTENMSIYSEGHTLYVYAQEAGNITITSIDGISRSLPVVAGSNNFTIAAKGIYVVNGQKIVIR